MTAPTTDGTPTEITIRQAAHRAGVSSNCIRTAARYGHLTLRRAGPLGTNVLAVSEFEAWQERRQARRQTRACS